MNRTAFQFFLTQYTGPHRVQNAGDSARAESVARMRGITFDWQDDDDPCSGCECGSSACPCATGAPHRIEGCVARTPDGEVCASLWGICEADRDYRRVIEADLAAECVS